MIKVQIRGQCICFENPCTYYEIGIDVRSYTGKVENTVRSYFPGCVIFKKICSKDVLKTEKSSEV